LAFVFIRANPLDPRHPWPIVSFSPAATYCRAAVEARAPEKNRRRLDEGNALLPTGSGRGRAG
jgi:hypothetical protein